MSFTFALNLEWDLSPPTIHPVCLCRNTDKSSVILEWMVMEGMRRINCQLTVSLSLDLLLMEPIYNLPLVFACLYLCGLLPYHQSILSPNPASDNDVPHLSFIRYEGYATWKSRSVVVDLFVCSVLNQNHIIKNLYICI